MRDPAIRYPEIAKNPFTAVPLAFSVSPPKGSKPVTRIFMGPPYRRSAHRPMLAECAVSLGQEPPEAARRPRNGAFQGLLGVPSILRAKARDRGRGVEPRGIEPLTFSLRTKRSTN